MEITAQTIITAGAVLAAALAILKSYNRAYDLVKHQSEQDKKIASLENDMTASIEALVGIMNGLIELGCNGNLHKSRDQLLEYLAKRNKI